MDGRRPTPTLPIRLLALDIDGTLIGEDLILRERTRHAVAAAHHRGVAVSLVTGRMASSARGFAEVLGLDGPIVAYQGGVIRAMPTVGSRSVGRLLVHRPLAIDVAREAIVWSRAHDVDPHINHLERFIIRADDPLAEDYSAFLGARAELVRDIVDAVRHPISKILAVGEEHAVHAALPRAQATFAGRAEVTVSHPRFLEFVAPGVTKGGAVRWLARHYGVRTARYKLIYLYGYGDWELYDMEADRTELNNLAGQIPKMVNFMARQYATWAKRSNVLPWDQAQGAAPPKPPRK